MLQARIPVLPGDDEDTLNARIQAREHQIYPEVIGWFADGRLALGAAGVLLDAKPIEAPILR